MASLELRSEGGYRIVFRVNGKKYGKSIETKCEHTANVALAQLELNLKRLRRGKIQLQPGDDVAAVLLSQAPRRAKRRPSPKPVKRRKKAKRRRESRSLHDLLHGYLDSVNRDSIEDSTCKMMEIHIRHLERILGGFTRPPGY